MKSSLSFHNESSKMARTLTDFIIEISLWGIILFQIGVQIQYYKLVNTGYDSGKILIKGMVSGSYIHPFLLHFDPKTNRTYIGAVADDDRTIRLKSEENPDFYTLIFNTETDIFWDQILIDGTKELSNNHKRMVYGVRNGLNRISLLAIYPLSQEKRLLDAIWTKSYPLVPKMQSWFFMIVYIYTTYMIAVWTHLHNPYCPVLTANGLIYHMMACGIVWIVVFNYSYDLFCEVLLYLLSRLWWH